MAKQKNIPAKVLQTISALEFANRFARSTREQGQRFTWFFGAGCSISSGIPAAGQLVERWIKEVADIQQILEPQLGEWIKKHFRSYDAKRPASSYAEVFKRRHPAPIDRQREIEIICAQAEPAYGYATFAQLLSLEDVGGLCNTVLTTNFDDLVLEALYMYGDRSARPQIISHEALTRYVRISSPRPTIVKLHGDAHLDPKNLAPETEKISDEVSKHLYPFIQDSALVFVGYGGNDVSIANFFSDCPEAALASQIYWVSKQDPPPALCSWLLEREALRVDHTDFDRLMHHLRGALKFGHPKQERWKENYDQYFKQYTDFEKEVKVQPTSQERDALLQVSEETKTSLPPDRQVIYAAYLEDNSKKSKKIFEEGIEKFPQSAELHNAFGCYLFWNKLAAEAEAEFRTALELDPNEINHSYNLGAVLIRTKDPNKEAGDLLLRSVESEKKDARALAQYAVYLDRVTKDEDGAFSYFRKAAALKSPDSSFATNYGQFLLLHGDVAEGCTYIRKALADKPEAHLATRALLCQYIFDKSRSAQALKTLHQQLLKGSRAYYWDVLPIVEFVHKNKVSSAPFIEALAKVIGGEAALSTLNEFPAWTKAARSKTVAKSKQHKHR